MQPTTHQCLCKFYGNRVFVRQTFWASALAVIPAQGSVAKLGVCRIVGFWGRHVRDSNGRADLTMQGRKHIEPRLFYQVSLEQFVPQDHLVRRLAAVLDLGWVRSATAASEDDTAVVPELFEKHEQHCGRPQQAVADRLYGSQDCLGYLQGKGIETVIRPRQGGNKHGGLSKRQFTYDARHDVYHCPGGEVLYRRRRQRKDGKAFYSADPDVCRSCPLRPQCVTSKSPDAVRQVTRFDNGYLERAQAACRSPHGQRLLKHRQTCIEGLFGQAKNWHGLGRARWRGRIKMGVQTLLTAAVLNLKKLLKAASRRPALARQAAVLSANPLHVGVFCLFLTRQLRPVLAGATYRSTPSESISKTHFSNRPLTQG